MNRLTQCTVVGEELAIAFSDGAEYFLPLAVLRKRCPCAVCQGEPDALGRVIRPEVGIGVRGYKLRKFEPVGGYGLQLFWGDGHSSGIYSFDYLKRIDVAQSS